MLGRLSSLDGGPTDFIVFLFHGTTRADGVVTVAWDMRAKNTTVVACLAKHPQFSAFLGRAIDGPPCYARVGLASRGGTPHPLRTEHDALKEWQSMRRPNNKKASAVPPPRGAPPQQKPQRTSTPPPIVKAAAPASIDDLFS